MELGVWVEDSLRVVCGLSLHTTVQDVVIALAQDLGRTGRYVLTLKLFGSEKQLLKDDCPLKELSILGPNSKDAQFFLRRTGPTVSGLYTQKPSSRDKHYPRTRTPDPLPSKPPKEHHEEPSSLYGTYPRRGRTKKAPPVEKETLYLQLLQQTRRIRELEEHMEELERQTPEENPEPVLQRDLKEQLQALEERYRQNEEELLQEQYWRGQLEEEERRDGDLNHRLEQLQWSVHHQTQRLDSLQSRSHSLQAGVRQRSEEALKPLQEELQQRHQQGDRISAALEETQRLILTTERRMKSQKDLLEELSKEIRQCNLQQFILQASGSAPSDTLVQSLPGAAPSDLTNLLPSQEIYLSNAGILE